MKKGWRRRRERWKKWRWEGGLARVTCFKSLASLFNGVLGGKPGQGNVKLYFSADCNYPRYFSLFRSAVQIASVTLKW